MKRFSDYFYETFANKIGGKVKYHGEKDVEIIDMDGIRIVKFYGTKKLVIRNKKVVSNYPIRSMNYLISRVK